MPTSSTNTFVQREEKYVRILGRDVSQDMIMSAISLLVTLPFALKSITERENKYFRTFGTIGLGAAFLYNLDAFEAERKRIELEKNEIL